jgi:hypothetical protein
VHGKNEHFTIRVGFHYFGGGVEAVHARHADIHKNGIWFQLLRQPHGFWSVRGFPSNLPVILSLQDVAYAVPNDIVVVDDENAVNGEGLLSFDI